MSNEKLLVYWKLHGVSHRRSWFKSLTKRFLIFHSLYNFGGVQRSCEFSRCQTSNIVKTFRRRINLRNEPTPLGLFLARFDFLKVANKGTC